MTSSAQVRAPGGLLEAAVAPARTIYRYGTDVNSHDLVKVLAIATMVVDHTGKFFVDDNVWLRIVGRMAAPLFFFLVGYTGSYRFKSQILILGIGLSAIWFLTNPGPANTILGPVEHVLPLNILFSFVLIKMVLNRIDPARMSTEVLLIGLGILIAASPLAYIVIEYGTIGLCYAVGARLLTQHHPLGRFWICATVGVHFLFEMVFGLVWRADVTMSTLPYAILLLALVFILSLVIFLNYDLRTFAVRPSWLRTLVLYVSRYSLQIYFFHLAGFMIVARVL